MTAGMGSLDRNNGHGAEMQMQVKSLMKGKTVDGCLQRHSGQMDTSYNRFDFIIY